MKEDPQMTTPSPLESDPDQIQFPPHVIHLIGKVGAGKTTFYHHYLAGYPCFDMKQLYAKYNFAPKDICAENYAKYERLLRWELTETFKNAPKVGVVESSGINAALSKLLPPRPQTYTILLISNFHQAIERERDYAKPLNDAFQSKFGAGKVIYDNGYNWHIHEFLHTLPLEIMNLFSDKNETIP